LRPQPASASAAAASRTNAHLDDNGLEIRFTAISPKRPHHTKIASLWRDPEIKEICDAIAAQPNFRSFSSRLSQLLACVRTFLGAVPP
jgi:hypothetical protein